MITAASTLLTIRDVAKNIEENQHYIKRMLVIVFKSPECIWPTHAKQTLKMLIVPALQWMLFVRILVPGWWVKPWVEQWRWKSCTNSHGCCTSASSSFSSGLMLFPLVWSEGEFTAIGHFSSRYCWLNYRTASASSASLKFHIHYNHLQSTHFLILSNHSPTCLLSLPFQCLVDCIGLSCTLVRGEYNRAWNEVLLFTGSPSSNGRSSLPCRYIVDLLHQPGSLLKANTPAAVQYQTI